MDFLLKQRLVGAIVLVALGVIFIPMLLESPDRTLVPKMEALPEPIDRQLSEPLNAFPAPDAIPEEPEEAVVLAEPEPQPAPPAEAKLKPEPEPEKKSEQVGVAGGSQEQPEPLSPTPVPQAKSQETGPLGSWVVQVGSFSSEQNALRLRDKLRKGGFVTQVEKAQVAGKSHYRVRVGPFLERADAEQKQQQLRDKFTIKGRVLSYP